MGNLINKLALIILILLLSTGNVSGVTNDLEGKQRKYKAYIDIQVKSEDGYHSKMVKFTIDYEIKFADVAQGDSIFALLTVKHDVSFPYLSYMNGMYYFKVKNQKYVGSTSYNISDDPNLMVESIYTIEQSVINLNPTSSIKSYYFFVRDINYYVDRLYDIYENLSWINMYYEDAESFRITSGYLNQNSLLVSSGDVLISETMNVNYEEYGLLKHLNYNIVANYEGIEIVNISYELKSGLFRGISFPVFVGGIVLLIVILVFLIKRKFF